MKYCIRSNSAKQIMHKENGNEISMATNDIELEIRENLRSTLA